MAHDTLANTPEELGMIARMLRKRIEESDRKRELLFEELGMIARMLRKRIEESNRKRELLVEELRLVEEKKANLEQKA